MHAISSYHGNIPTNTDTQTYRQDQLQYTALLTLARSVLTTKRNNEQITDLYSMKTVFSVRYVCV